MFPYLTHDVSLLSIQGDVVITCYVAAVKQDAVADPPVKVRKKAYIHAAVVCVCVCVCVCSELRKNSITMYRYSLRVLI